MTNNYLVLHTDRYDASKSKAYNVEATSPAMAACIAEDGEDDVVMGTYYQLNLVNFSAVGWVVEGEESDVYVLLK